MMTIMIMCCAILTIAYYISTISTVPLITAGSGKLAFMGWQPTLALTRLPH